MKKYILILLLLIFIPNVYSLDCQYTQKEHYTMVEPKLVDTEHNDNILGNPLYWDSFVKSTENKDTFKIYNTLNRDIKIMVTANHIVSSGMTGTSVQPFFQEVEILENSFATISAWNAYDSVYNTYIDNSSIKYEFIEPSNVSIKYPELTKSKEVCKMCGNDVCLNDNASCNPLYDNSICGSGICSIAGFCAHEKILICPVGTKNCNDSLCLTPSALKNGEKYMCEWQCKSQEGKDEICVKEPWSIFEIVLRIVILILVLCVSIYYFAIYKRKKEEDEKKKIEEEINILIKDKDNLNSNINRLNSKKNELNEDIKFGKSKIQKLKTEIKNTKGIAKHKFEEDIKHEEEKQRIRLNDLEKNNKRMIEEQKRQNITEQKIKEREKELSEKGYDTYIKEQEIKYQRKYNTPSMKVFYDQKSGYFKVKYSDGNENYLHLIIYKRIGLKNDEEIHHIDNDALNNELWNLIALKKENHNKLFGKFKHSKLEKGNWELGIEELKKQLGMDEKDFPKHILDHLNNLHNKKINDFS